MGTLIFKKKLLGHATSIMTKKLPLSSETYFLYHCIFIAFTTDLKFRSSQFNLENSEHSNSSGNSWFRKHKLKNIDVPNSRSTVQSIAAVSVQLAYSKVFEQCRCHFSFNAFKIRPNKICFSPLNCPV